MLFENAAELTAHGLAVATLFWTIGLRIDLGTDRGKQIALRNAGFDPGEIGGAFGPKSSRALGTFQASVGPEATGKLDDATATALVNAQPPDVRLHSAIESNCRHETAASCEEGEVPAARAEYLDHVLVASAAHLREGDMLSRDRLSRLPRDYYREVA